jgi:hypothetical protein
MGYDGIRRQTPFASEAQQSPVKPDFKVMRVAIKLLTLFVCRCVQLLSIPVSFTITISSRPLNTTHGASSLMISPFPFLFLLDVGMLFKSRKT